MIGGETQGAGARVVVVMNDWLCDTSTWDGARPYLDGERFTWAFADLRGYGRSMGMGGAFTLEEAASDVIALADARGWSRFVIVGHSMSSLIALHLAQHFPERIARAVVLCPPPVAGFGTDDATLAQIHAMVRDDAKRTAFVRSRLGDDPAEGWARFKAERWIARADREAVAAYATVFAQRGLPDRAKRVACPVLAVTGERDVEVMRRESVTGLLAPICERLEVKALAESGHYPMQEAPPALVGIVERFAGA